MKNYFIKAIICIIILFVVSCTVNVSMAHTEGTASDVIDDTATTSPDISPTIDLPLPTL